MKLQESGENYLETILRLSEKKPQVRSIDIANELDFSKPSVSVASVSRALGILKNDGDITVEQSGNICLTDDGMKKASSVYDRHVTITHYLSEVLGVTPSVAEADACRIEHIISEETFLKIKAAYNNR